MGPRVPLVLLLTLVIAPALEAQDEPDPLEPEKPTRSVVPDWEDQNYRSFVLDVPEDAKVLKIVVEDAPVDLDLFARFEQPIEDYEAEDVLKASSEQFNDALVVARTSQPPLVPGKWYVDVVYALEVEPRAGKRVLEEIPFTIAAHIIHARVDGEIRPGTPFTSRTDPEDGFFRTFVVEVPKNAEAVRIDLDDVRSDLDLRVRSGGQIVDPAEAQYTAETSLGRESLVVDRESEPPLAPGKWFINVYDPWEVGVVPFTIHVTIGRTPPPILLDLAPFREAIDPIDHSILCTVEINGPEGGGSGTILTPDGLILTNHHVVALASGGVVADGELVIGVSQDGRVPAVEMFRARVLAHDERLDLALVEVKSGLHGQPIPAGYRFPYLEIGDADALRIGDPLTVIGYPAAGGSGSRVSVTLTRGVVSGFDNTDVGLVIKTDADISAGNSGGAALDQGYRLIGVPSYVVPEAEGNAQMGYIHAVSLVPPDWRRMIEERKIR